MRLFVVCVLLGNFGGLLGLCLGFSLISLIEFIYFGTVRLYGNIPMAFGANECQQAKTGIRQRQHIDRLCLEKMSGYRTYARQIESIR